jgi:hypothetical protein
LQERATDCLSRLPAVVTEVLYRECAESRKDYSGRDTWTDIQTAIEEDYLNKTAAGRVGPNHEHPAVNDAENAIQELSSFVEKLDPMNNPDEERQALFNDFVERLGIRPRMANRQFWEKFLGLSKLYKS